MVAFGDAFVETIDELMFLVAEHSKRKVTIQPMLLKGLFDADQKPQKLW